MKRLILSLSAAAVLALGAMPNTAEACGGYVPTIDPVERQIQLVVAEHFTKVRSSVRLQRVSQVRYDDAQAIATVIFVDRRQRLLSQDVRLSPRGESWVVVGGSQVSRV